MSRNRVFFFDQKIYTKHRLKLSFAKQEDIHSIHYLERVCITIYFSLLIRSFSFNFHFIQFFNHLNYLSLLSIIHSPQAQAHIWKMELQGIISIRSFVNAFVAFINNSTIKYSCVSKLEMVG